MAKGIPFDSPLYEFDDERGVEFRNSEAAVAFFTMDGDVANLLPEGLKLSTEPPQGGIWIGHYPFSTLGAYDEYIAGIQVEDLQGEVGLYVPYIYVTNDAALAMGREVVGAPKKFAKIELKKEYDVVQGILERPSGKRLATLTVKPNSRAASDVVDGVFPKPMLCFSVRHLPAVGGKGGVTQLVKWYSEMNYHVDPKGERVVFTGPTSLTYDSNSVVDPVHKLKVKEILAGFYLQLDFRVGTLDILKEY